MDSVTGQMTMTGNRTTLAALGFTALVVLGVLAGAAAPVAAQSDDGGVVDALFGGEDDDEPGMVDSIQAFVGGIMDRYSPFRDRPPEASADEYAEDVRTEFNAHNTTLMDWANARSTADKDHDVVRIRFTDSDGDGAWLFIVATVNTTTGNYTSAEAMGMAEFEDTGRQIDLTYRLEPYASRNAHPELEHFITEYAEPGKDVNRSYLIGLAGEYRGQVSGDELPGDS